MESKQRKLLSNLLMSGTALIVVALLDAIKLVLYFAVDPTYRYILETIFSADQTLGWTIVGLLGGGTVLEVLVGCYIGFSARAEAKGGKRNIFYVVVAIIMAIVLSISSVSIFIESFLSQITVFSVIEALVSFGFSAVVVYSLVDIIISSIKNRKINKENGKTINESINIESINIVDEEMI